MADRTVTVELPAALAAVAGARRVDVAVPPAATLADVLDALAVGHPLVARRLRDEQGRLRRFVNVYLGEDEVRSLAGTGAPEAVPVGGHRHVVVIPSIAGG